MRELESTVRLVERWRNGEQAAATSIDRRFRPSLAALVARWIGRRLQRRIDAEDALQSVFRTFFRRAQTGQFTVVRTGQLWRLLTEIARHKVQQQAERHTAAKRRMGAETANVRLLACGAGGASFECEVALLDEVRAVLQQHSERDATIVQMRLAGYSVVEIADALACSRWTARRVLDRVGGELERRLNGGE